MIKRRGFLAGMAGAWLTLGREARADGVSDALAEVAKARASLKTLIAPFTQERTIGLLSTVVKSAGELTLVRPDRLRWELKPPDAVTYWIGPEGLAYATPSGGASVGKSAAGRFGAVLGDLLTFLGGDLEKLRGRYDLTVPERKDGMVIVARPTADEVKKHVRSIEVGLGADLWSVKRVVIEESGGDRSVIVFGKAVRDEKVDPARMAPPKTG